MAKKKGTKGLDVQIKELEAVINAARGCPSCGKAVEPEAATCPHCGAVLGEGADLEVEADKSLQDLERHLEAAVETPPKAPGAPAPTPPERDADGLGMAAEVAAEVEPDTTLDAGAAAEPGPETVPDAVESRDLEGFIEEIEAEVGTPPAASPRTARVHAVPRAAVRRRSSRWAAAVGGGLVLYLVAVLTSVAILPDIGKFATASVMVMGSVLVAVGIHRLQGGSPPPVSARVPAREGAPDYVCPLCGTGIPEHASECPTCGALFED